jgi:hypothetical protein
MPFYVLRSTFVVLSFVVRRSSFVVQASNLYLPCIRATTSSLTFCGAGS